MNFWTQTRRLVLMIVVVLFLTGPAQAAIVSQLNIQEIQIALDVTGGDIVGGSTQGGTILSGVFQPPSPPIMPDFNGLGSDSNQYTFSLFTNTGPDGFPAPSAMVDAGLDTITVDLRSLFTQVTGPGSGLIPGGSAFLRIGHDSETVTGTYDSGTGNFEVTWMILFHPDTDFLQGGQVTIDGTAGVAPVPVPASALLFGTGIASLAGVLWKKKTVKP